MIAAILSTLALAGAFTQATGSIRGTVVNTSAEKPAPCACFVVLQVRTKGEFVLYEQKVSSADGTFEFHRLPVGPDCLYLVGASRHGIFYPGPRVQLSESRPNALVELSVCDAVTKPNPLVLRRFEITIHPEPGLLRVTESLDIDNPSSTCYVGEPPTAGAEPSTLQLAIPPEFERTTFDKEFFGRRFVVADGKVVTGVPWPPGQRELAYTYVLRNTQPCWRWERPLDLPCRRVIVRVEAAKSNQVQCSLPKKSSDENGMLVFESDGQTLPAGERLQVELGHLPLAWMSYLRWAAVATLLALVACTAGVLARSGRWVPLALPVLLPNLLETRNAK